jgi:DnaJ-domain-containing protein 1
MLYLLGGFAILCGLLLLGYLFVNAEPARLARILKWTAIGLGVATAVASIIARPFVLFFAIPGLLSLVLPRLLRMFAGTAAPSAGTSSTVETAFVRMSLDHDTGRMTGTVLRGRFAGLRLEELGRADLLSLLRECRAEDEESARLVEAYLDRAHPDWREDVGGARSGSAPPPSGSSADVTVEEAYAILGLAPGADAAAIKAAHHRLMKQLHPDHGGTDYLATKINRARDVLLNR